MRLKNSLKQSFKGLILQCINNDNGKPIEQYVKVVDVNIDKKNNASIVYLDCNKDGKVMHNGGGVCPLNDIHLLFLLK